MPTTRRDLLLLLQRATNIVQSMPSDHPPSSSGIPQPGDVFERYIVPSLQNSGAEWKENVKRRWFGAWEWSIKTPFVNLASSRQQMYRTLKNLLRKGILRYFSLGDIPAGLLADEERMLKTRWALFYTKHAEHISMILNWPGNAFDVGPWAQNVGPRKGRSRAIRLCGKQLSVFSL